MAWALVLGSGLAVLLPWLGYPALMRLLARAVPSGAAPRAAWAPTVTCILASRDSAEAIRARVQNFHATAYDPRSLTVVVGLDWSARERADEIRRAVEGLATVVVAGADGGKPIGLNAAVAAATGELLVFSDTGQRFDRDTIPALVAGLAEPRAGAVSGSLQLPGAAAGPMIRAYWALERRLRRDEARVHSAVGVTGAVYAMRRELWKPLPAGLLLDDLYVPLRLVMAGHRIGWSDDAVATEARHFDDRDEYRRKVRTLTGNLQIIAWLPGVLLPWRNPVLAQFVLHKLLRLLTPIWLTTGAIGTGWLAIERLGPGRAALSLGLPAAAIVAAGAIFPPFRRALVTAVQMQLATLRALWNGATGHWEVWTS